MTTQLQNDQRFQSFFQKLMPSYLRPSRLGEEKETVLDNVSSPTSLIFSPAEGQRIGAGDVIVKGYAVADTCREIECVELSMDKGKTWAQTELSPNLQPGEWRLWKKHLSLAPGQYTLVVRATDNLPNKGPSDLDLTWHQVSFEVVA